MPGRGMLPGGRVYDLIGQPLEVEPGSERDWSEGAVAWEWNALRQPGLAGRSCRRLTLRGPQTYQWEKPRETHEFHQHFPPLQV